MKEITLINNKCHIGVLGSIRCDFLRTVSLHAIWLRERNYKMTKNLDICVESL